MKKMAVPKRSELANRQKKKLERTNTKEQSDESIYLGMKWDYENGHLVGYRLEKFLALRKQYESKQ